VAIATLLQLFKYLSVCDDLFFDFSIFTAENPDSLK
jgi:hypothetical protein